MFRYQPRNLIVDSSTDATNGQGGRVPLIFKPNMLFKFVTSGTKESFVTRTNALLFYALISISDVIMSIAMRAFKSDRQPTETAGVVRR